MNNIFVGNLSFQATKEDLIKLFEPFGAVANAVIMERKKGKSRGYGFVDMPNEEEKNAAIVGLSGKEFMWRVLSVSPVIPKVPGEEKPKKFKSEKKEWKPRESQAATQKSTESKYYSKFDGPPKPWRKVNKDTGSPRKEDRGARPYYGKKDDRAPRSGDKRQSSSDFYSGGNQASGSKDSGAGAKKPYKKFDGQSKPFAKREDGGSKYSTKPSGSSFKMLHKVSGVARNRPKKAHID